MVEKNDIITLEIAKTTYGGRGLGRIDDFVVFVEGVVPGDVISAKVVKKKTNYAEAEVIEILKPSIDRIEPLCPIFGNCGGCTWQNLSYEVQIKHKEEISFTSLEHIGKITPFSSYPIIPSPQIWRYRNKMDFTFGTDNESKITLGLHKKGSFSDIIDVEKCLICPESFETILEGTKSFCRKNNFTSYNPQTHIGQMRHLIIREGRNTGDLIVVLLTASKDIENIENLYCELKNSLPNLRGFIWGLNASRADAPNIDEIIYQGGEDYFFERIGELTFQISAFSFFQTNTTGTEKLYQIIKDYFELEGNEIIFDAYCGSGTIGLFTAQKEQTVYGIDIICSSIWDARKNAKMNGFKNTTFLVGDMKQTISLMLQGSKRRINRIIVDPPRCGMEKKSLRQIIDIDAPIIVYVSCNPTTLARDIEVITQAGYTLAKAQPLDMFPHTYHIEMVVQFKK